MRRLKSILGNERGYLLLNVVFLMMITAFAGMIVMNAAPRAKNPQSTLRLIAIHLANEQFAQLESRASTNNLDGGNYPFLGDANDLTNYISRKENSTTSETVENPVEFTVETNVDVEGNLRRATVTVKIVGDETFELEAERTMRVAQ